MTKKIRREIAYLKCQTPIMNDTHWKSLIDVLETLADRIDQLEDEKVTKRGI